MRTLRSIFTYSVVKVPLDSFAVAHSLETFASLLNLRVVGAPKERRP